LNAETRGNYQKISLSNDGPSIVRYSPERTEQEGTAPQSLSILSASYWPPSNTFIRTRTSPIPDHNHSGRHPLFLMAQFWIGLFW